MVENPRADNVILLADLYEAIRAADPGWRAETEFGARLHRDMDKGWREAIGLVAEDPDTRQYAEVLIELVRSWHEMYPDR